MRPLPLTSPGVRLLKLCTLRIASSITALGLLALILAKSAMVMLLAVNAPALEIPAPDGSQVKETGPAKAALVPSRVPAARTVEAMSLEIRIRVLRFNVGQNYAEPM